MKDYGLNRSGFVFCFVIGFFILANPALSANYCVDNATDLQAALDAAATNGQDDFIRVVQRTYTGNFVYSSTEAFGLSIEGGYTTGCLERVVDATNTVLDAQGSGPVLVFSAPDVTANFVVDGLTIRNGISSLHGGGGIFCTANGGNSILSNNIFTNNAAIIFGGGAIFFQNNESITLKNNTISENKSHVAGGGAFFNRIKTVNLQDNNIMENQAGDSGNSGDGGGFYLIGSSSVTLDNNSSFAPIAGT